MYKTKVDILPFMRESTIVEYYPYESVYLRDVILNVEERDSEIGDYFHTLLRNEGYLWLDNKSTIKIKCESGSIFYIQFYDCDIRIGLSIDTRNTYESKLLCIPFNFI